MNTGDGGPSKEDMVAEVLQTALMAAEAKVDRALEALENPDDDELDRIRASRLASMKKKQVDMRLWADCGHGEYTEIPSEKDFFPTVQKSKLTVVHFYRQATFRCQIVDKHLKILAPKHMETKFVKLNAEKCPFLVEKLAIKVLPTVLIVVDSQIVDRIVGFTDLGGTDDFTTEIMEWRLGVGNGIHYTGDKSVPPYQGKPSKKPTVIGKNIRGSTNDRDSDSDEEETSAYFKEKDNQNNFGFLEQKLAKVTLSDVDDDLDLGLKD